MLTLRYFFRHFTSLIPFVFDILRSIFFAFAILTLRYFVFHILPLRCFAFDILSVDILFSVIPIMLFR